ncbi:MAG: hypothetical protein H6R14_1438 [Proteobacteria bacterium]|nr:hypothetical protein [Pseudomonadota bacterium]
MKKYSPAKLADRSARSSPERPIREREADRLANHAFDNRAHPTSSSTQRRHLSSQLNHGSPFQETGGQTIAPAMRAPFEQAFGHDFSRVRVFSSGETANAVLAAGSRAIAYGPHIALAPGQWAPETSSGRALLAHELAHVVQQASEGKPRLDHKTLDEEIDEELKAKTGDQKSLNPNNVEYARSLQEYGHDITHKSPTELLPEPKDPKAKEAWKRQFQKAANLADRILKGGPDVDQKENRAEQLAADLAKAGFVDEAMALAPRITDPDLRKFIYLEVLGHPGKLSEAHVAKLAQDQAASATKCSDHALLTALGDDGKYAAKLGGGKVIAALKTIVKAYAADAALPEKLANILRFFPAARADFADWMMADKSLQPLLRTVSDNAYFNEGMKDKKTNLVTMPDDPSKGWAVGNRQRLTIEDVMGLLNAAGAAVTAPAARDINTLKAWLEANTENIGAALAKQYPGNATKAEAMYTQIVEAFMWHLPADTKEDVKPEKNGHITGLIAAGPQNKQFKVDCDVLATYGVRLLVASGFTPIGYMAIKPKDKKRLGHAMALLKQGNNFRAISNSTTKDLGAVTKEKALEMLRDFGIEDAYDADNELTAYDIFYMDSDAKGTLPDAVLNQVVGGPAHHKGLSVEEKSK